MLTFAWGITLWRAAPVVTGAAAWERIATSGERAISAARERQLSPEQRARVDAHEAELRSSLEQARRYNYLAGRTAAALALAAAIALALLALIASRVAGHLSRQLSRPIDELVGWTKLIAHGESLPDTPPRRGAPEFETLRRRMRKMAAELDAGRRQALEAERLRAFRESAQRVAHELKNPLTPIRLATARIARQAPPDLADAVDVLTTETERLERMSRSFAQFGRLPEGAVADIHVGDLARYAAQATVPPGMQLDMNIDEGLPLIRGHHDALASALSNVLLNAVEAAGEGGRIQVDADTTELNGARAVRVRVGDSGPGIDETKLTQMWEPYITDKPGGTGLGLAITRQAVHAHGGSVSATSARGRGTTVELVLPVASITNPR